MGRGTAPHSVLRHAQFAMMCARSSWGSDLNWLISPESWCETPCGTPSSYVWLSAWPSMAEQPQRPPLKH